MKTKSILLASLAILAISCQKEAPSTDGSQTSENFTIFANIADKTVLNPDWTVSWNSTDRLSVFNAEAGTATYSDNCRFVISDPASGSFTKDPEQSGKSLVTGKESYDWYACYPWMEYGGAPGTTKGYAVATAPQQVGYNSSTAVAGYDILAGVQKGVTSGTSPVFSMKHVCTLFKITVTNCTGKAAAITGLSLDASAGGSYITGSFTMDWNNLALDPTQMGSSKSYLCNLNVVKNVGTKEEPQYEKMDTLIENGASVDLYFVTAPFSVSAGKQLVFTITGSLGNLELKKTMSSDITFAAGSYNTASLDYTEPDYVVFTETFGASTVTYANVPNYNKAGLTTAVAEHKAQYTYAAYNNTSFQMCNTKNGGINSPAYSGTVLQGAACKLPNGTASITIGNITVEENTTYVFKYNKSRGVDSTTKEYVTTTAAKWRTHGTTAWTVINTTDYAGTISQEFNVGENTSIDICVAATATSPTGSITWYPAVDYFQLIKKK